MDWQLDTAEVRVLGALLEKEISTPEYYPLSLSALVNACNQKSNRDPVVAYDDDTVEDALERLRLKGLTSRITGRDSRVPKHEQRFTEKYNLGRREAAILCVLMLRGWQTPGELRGRSERLHTFDDLDEVESTLGRLTEMEYVVIGIYILEYLAASRIDFASTSAALCPSARMFRLALWSRSRDNPQDGQ